MSGIGQSGAVRYLAVNVYPGSGRWNVAVMVREPGRPYPRLVRNLATIPLPSDTEDLHSALLAASEALARMADEVPSTASRAAAPASP